MKDLARPRPPAVPSNFTVPCWIFCGSIFSIFLLLLAPTLAFAQTSGFEVRGYAKNLGIRAASAFDGKAYVLDVSRLRLRGLADAGSRLHAEVWLDSEVLAGSFLRTADYQFARGSARRPFVDLDWTILSTGDVLIRQQLFRAFATAYLGPSQLTVGRQRIAWGTGFAWNPTDLFNPFNPAAIELDEKAGVDAAYLAVPLGALSRFEVAVAPGRVRAEASAAVRASTHVGEYDLAAMAGVFREDVVVGGDFAGYVGNAGFRGEAAYTFAERGDDYLRAILNADYTFAGGYYVLAEVYFNGSGTRDRGAYDLAALLDGRTFNLAKDYAAVSVGHAFTPLLAGSLYGLANLDDQSALAGPALAYSLRENLDVSAATYLFLGEAGTEFGAQRNVYFASIQVYF